MEVDFTKTPMSDFGNRHVIVTRLYSFYTIQTNQYPRIFSSSVRNLILLKDKFVCVICAAVSCACQDCKSTAECKCAEMFWQAFCAAVMQVKKSVFAVAEVVKLWERRPTEGANETQRIVSHRPPLLVKPRYCATELYLKDF